MFGGCNSTRRLFQSDKSQEIVAPAYTELSHSPASSAFVRLRSIWPKSQLTTEAASTSVKPSQMLSCGAATFADVQVAPGVVMGYDELSHLRVFAPFRRVFLALAAAFCRCHAGLWGEGAARAEGRIKNRKERSASKSFILSARGETCSAHLDYHAAGDIHIYANHSPCDKVHAVIGVVRRDICSTADEQKTHMLGSVALNEAGLHAAWLMD